MRWLLLLAISFFSARADAALSECQVRIMKVMGRISPADEAKRFVPSSLDSIAPERPEVAKSLQANAEVMVGKIGRLKFQLSGPAPFAVLHQKLKSKGFWMIMNPSPAGQRLVTGHASIVIGDSLFNRLSDDLGPEAMRSIPVKDVAALFMNSNETPFLVAQFYEVSESSLATLSKFFHDRTWHYHEGLAEWRPRYERLPLSPEMKNVDCENCSLFSWSFLDPRWSLQVPELGDIQSEIGEVVVDQIPLQQIFNNSGSRAYRGTVLIAKNPVETEKFLEDGTFSADAVGAQTLFHDFKKIR
jgi:hypothetical protein